MKFELVSRNTVFESNPILAKQVICSQKIMYDPSEAWVQPGETIFMELSDEAPTLVTEELALKLNKEHVEHCKSMCDEYEEPLEEFQFVGEVIAELPLNNLEEFFRSIGNKMENFCQQMGWEKVLVVPDCINPYLAQKNNYPPVKDASVKLSDMGICREYSGGIVLSTQTISSFFENIFWIVRCNASAPCFIFSGVNSPIIGTLCKHGNIHYECYDDLEKKKLISSLASAGFVCPSNGRCEERFSSTGAIDGRVLDLGFEHVRDVEGKQVKFD